MINTGKCSLVLGRGLMADKLAHVTIMLARSSERINEVQKLLELVISLKALTVSFMTLLCYAWGKEEGGCL